MSIHHQHPIVIVGAGLSGLISAALLARRGFPVVVLERAAALGGRSATRDRNGYLFNLGPHALYRGGLLRQTLKDLGVTVTGGIATGEGGFAIAGGRTHTLPIGPTSLMTTDLLGVGGKLEFARVYARLPFVDASAIQHQTLASWLDDHLHDRMARQLFEMIVRVATFTNDPEHQSAGAAIEQMQLAIKGSVIYVDGGWQTIVEGVRRAALEAGAQIRAGAAAVGLERCDSRIADAVRLADGSTIQAAAVILTGSPADVDSVTGVTALAASMPPAVRVSSLDIGLRSLPKLKRTVAFGVDAPLYFSVHSALARLAPDGGATIHVAKYLHPDETADRTVEHELEALTDMMQPGWRDQLVVKHFIPSLVVTYAECVAARGGAAGRPSPRLADFDNVFAAGEWVGSRGQLSDACAASAAEAVDLAAHAVARPRRGTLDVATATR